MKKSLFFVLPPHFAHLSLGMAIAALAMAPLFGCGGSSGSAISIPSENIAVTVEPYLEQAAFPSALAFSPEGELYFSELPTGNIRRVKDNELSPEPVVTIDTPKGSADGIYGIAFDPDFHRNRHFYVYHTAPSPRRNRVIRFREHDGKAVDPLILLDNIPHGGHNGGKLAFHRDKTLFVSTGDSDSPDLAQSMDSLAGKILRINRDGSIPSNNPFPESVIFAIGFRNVFGLAVHPQSALLFASDNGPNCDDELNVVIAGGNYGWRQKHVCGEVNPDFISPSIRINPSVGVTAVLFYRGREFREYENHILLADFNTGTIRRYQVERNSGVILEEALFFTGGAGPIIALAVDREGLVYASTPNAILRFRRS